MDIDLAAVAANVGRADTETLLDRLTVYRDLMEPAALDLIAGELARRGVTAAAVAAHSEQRRDEVLRAHDGTILRCDRCDRPAVRGVRGWYRVGGLVPVFQRVMLLCEVHTPAPAGDPPD